MVKFLPSLIAGFLLIGAALGTPWIADANGLTNRQISQLLFTRLTGTHAAVDSAVITAMSAEIASGDYRGAAMIAMSDGGFVRKTVRKFAAPIFTLDQTYRLVEQFSDGQALIMGLVNDGRDIKEAFYTTAYYQVRLGDGSIVNADANNGRLADLESRLVRTETHPVAGSYAAGILTTNEFAKAYYDAGTNRRPIDGLVQKTWCGTLRDYRFSGPDYWVGRDVSRTPLQQYRTECSTCHGGLLDNHRGAFAFLDYNGSLQYTPGTVRPKYARGAQNNGGYVVSDDSWESLLPSAMRDQVGWDPGQAQGNGAASFGRAWGTAMQTQRCMVENVRRVVCATRPSLPSAFVEEQAMQLLLQGNLKETFAAVATHPDCLPRN